MKSKKTYECNNIKTTCKPSQRFRITGTQHNGGHNRIGQRKRNGFSPVLHQMFTTGLVRKMYNTEHMPTEYDQFEDYNINKY